MQPLLSALSQVPEYQDLLAAAKRGGCLALSGLSPITRAHFIAALQQDLERLKVGVTKARRARDNCLVSPQVAVAATSRGRAT